MNLVAHWLVLIMSYERLLLSHRKRNKVVVVPVDKTESDLSYRRKEFMKAFNYANNTSIDVTFQKYDPNWENYVDLSNDRILGAKEKLKAVITPQIVTLCSILNDSVSLSAQQLPY